MPRRFARWEKAHRPRLLVCIEVADAAFAGTGHLDVRVQSFRVGDLARVKEMKDLVDEGFCRIAERS